MTIWRTRIVCWTTKATNTHSEYVTLIAFPLQLWLHVRTSMLRYTYISYLVNCKTNQLLMKSNINVAIFMALTPRELADRH